MAFHPNLQGIILSYAIDPKTILTELKELFDAARKEEKQDSISSIAQKIKWLCSLRQPMLPISPWQIESSVLQLNTTWSTLSADFIDQLYITELNYSPLAAHQIALKAEEQFGTNFKFMLKGFYARTLDMWVMPTKERREEFRCYLVRFANYILAFSIYTNDKKELPHSDEKEVKDGLDNIELLSQESELSDTRMG